METDAGIMAWMPLKKSYQQRRRVTHTRSSFFFAYPIEHLTYTTTDSPVIPAGFGTPSISSIVGAISASFPSLTPTT